MIRLAGLLAVCGFALVLTACAAQPQFVAVAPDHHHFTLEPSHKPFNVWGFNYDRDYKMRLLEDYWATEWPRSKATSAR